MFRWYLCGFLVPESDRLDYRVPCTFRNISPCNDDSTVRTLYFASSSSLSSAYSSLFSSGVVLAVVIVVGSILVVVVDSTVVVTSSTVVVVSSTGVVVVTSTVVVVAAAVVVSSSASSTVENQKPNPLLTKSSPNSENIFNRLTNSIIACVCRVFFVWFLGSGDDVCCGSDYSQMNV